MAFYTYEFEVPANTPENSSVTKTVQALSQKLATLRLIIPNGHQGLARIRIESRGRVIAPSSGSDPPWIRGDGVSVDMTPNLLLEGPPWEITFVGWNADTTFSHAFIVYADLLP